MQKFKQFLTEFVAGLFMLLVVIGWFQPDGYWKWVGVNPYDQIDYIFHFIMGLFN